MIIIAEKELKSGKRRVLLELDKHETPVAFNENAYYELGYPVEEIILGQILTDAVPVQWDSLEQRWLK